MSVDCRHEPDVLDAIASGRWPAAVEPALRAHAEGCESCAEIAGIASALRDDGDALCKEPLALSADQVWRRAAMRSRLEAQRAAARPIVVTERMAAACAAGILCAAVTWIGPWQPWAATATQVGTRLAQSCADLTIASGSAIGNVLPLLLGVTACALFAPIALYLLMADD